MATSASSGVADRSVKSAPDLAKLMGMTNRVVQVVRHVSRGGAGQLVLPAWKNVSVDNIVALQTELPVKHGFGTYSFEVYDEGGPDKDQWTVKLGPDVSEMASQATPWSNGGGMPGGVGGDNSGNAFTAATAQSGTTDLGNGYRYNADLGLLVTPQKQIINWRPGEDLPGSLPRNAAAAVSPLPGTPPWAQWAQPGTTPPWAGFGWNNNPIVDAPSESSAAIKALEERLRDSERQREDDNRRREADAMRTAFEKTIEANNARFEALVSRLAETNKPAVDPQVETLKATLASLQQEQAQGRREDAMRAEMRALQEQTQSTIREIAQRDNQANPVMTMLTQLMVSGQNSQAEVIKAMRDTAQSQAQAAERSGNLVAERLAPSIMTPMQIMEMVRLATAKESGGSELNTHMLGMFKDMFGMAQGIWRERAELQGGDNGPAWLPLAQEGMQTLGRVASVYAQSKARGEVEAATLARRQQQLQQQQQQQQVRVVAAQQVSQPVQQQMRVPVRRVPAAEAVQPAQQVVGAGPVPAQRSVSEIQRDAIANRVFGGPSAADAARAELADSVFKRKPVVSVEPAAEVVTPDAVAAPSPIEPRRRRKAKVAPAPVVVAAPPVVEEPEIVDEEDDQEMGDDGEGDSNEPFVASGEVPDLDNLAPEQIAEINAHVADASPETMRSLIADMGDAEFFGPALDEVNKLREALRTTPEEYTPESLGAFILTARQQLLNFGLFPPAIELLEAGHVNLLIERLLPGLAPAGVNAITQATKALMAQSGIGPQQ